VHGGVLKPQVPVTHNTEESTKKWLLFFISEFLENPCHFIVVAAIFTAGSTIFDSEQQRLVCS
jgi:hypothetical protein